MPVDLFDLVSRDRQTNAALPETADPGTPIIPKVASAERMKQILAEVLAEYAPPADEVARLRGSGWASPVSGNPIVANSWCARPKGVDCARWVVDTFEYPVSSVVGIIPEPMFRASLRAQFDKNIMDSVVNRATNQRRNGDWRPVEADAKVIRRMSLDRLVTTTWGTVQNGLEASPDIPPPTAMVEVPIEILQIAVRLVDIRNAPEIRVDAEGKAVPELVLAGGAPQTGTDPALLGALTSLGEGVKAMAERATATDAENARLRKEQEVLTGPTRKPRE